MVAPDEPAGGPARCGCPRCGAVEVDGQLGVSRPCLENGCTQRHTRRMALLADILAAALEAEPTEVNVWRATRRDQSRRFGHRLLDAYVSSELEPVPAKEEGEFRPAFLSTLAMTGNDIESNFVAKALLCSHSVAVPDDLLTWERLVESGPKGDFYVAESAVSVARKIARYADLERSGLLHYVSPLPLGMPQATDLDWADVRSASNLVVDRVGIHQDFADSESALMPYLQQWLGELRAVVSHVNSMDGWIDLYLPDWFSGPELLEWVLEHQLDSPPVAPADILNHRSLTKLLRLPTLDARANIEVALLLDIRDEAGFAEWRDSLRSLLRSVPPRPTLGDSLELVEEVEQQASVLESRVRSRSESRPALNGSLVAGVTLAGTELLTEMSTPEAIATAATAGLSTVVVEVVNWFRGSRQKGTSTPYRLFVDANSRGADGRITTPTASIFMYSSATGRPVADFLRGGL